MEEARAELGAGEQVASPSTSTHKHARRVCSEGEVFDWPRGLQEVVTQAGPSPIGAQQTKIKDLTAQELTQTAEACSVLCLTRPDLRLEEADGQGRKERRLQLLPLLSTRHIQS